MNQNEAHDVAKYDEERSSMTSPWQRKRMKITVVVVIAASIVALSAIIITSVALTWKRVNVTCAAEEARNNTIVPPILVTTSSTLAPTSTSTTPTTSTTTTTTTTANPISKPTETTTAKNPETTTEKNIPETTTVKVPETTTDRPAEELPPPVPIDPELLVNFNRTLILQIDDNTLWAKDVDSDEGKFIVRSSEVPFDSFDVYDNKNLYVGGAKGSGSVNTIKSSNAAFQDLRWPTIDWHARRIAVDQWSRKVYVVDDVGSKIDVIDMMHGYQSIVLPSLDDPVDIALDPSAGLMFVLQWASILRSNMDGTSLRAIVSDTDISAFAIETIKKQVFWVENLSLRCSDYDGNEPQTLLNFTSRVKSLAALENKLFWVISNSVSNSGYLWSCDFSEADGRCQKIKKQYFVQQNIVAIKAYDFGQELANPCDSSNCGQMCILAGNGSTTCACTISWQLEPDDSIGCRPIQDYLLYVEGDIVKGVNLDAKVSSFLSAMTPFKLANVSLVPQRTIAFDYDARRLQLYYRNEGSIYSVNMTGNTEEILLRNVSKSGAQSLAVDWVNGNIFYPDRSKIWAVIGENDIKSTNIMVYNRELNENIEERSIIKNSYSEQIESIALDPNRGHVYFATTARIGLIYRLHRMNQDSSGMIKLKDAGQPFASLCIDEKDRRLYWIYENAVSDTEFPKVEDIKRIERTNGSLNVYVYYIDLNDSELKNAKVRNLMLTLDIDQPITSMKVYGDWLYLANNMGIWRMPKEDSANGNVTGPLIRLVSLEHAKNRVIQGMYLYSERSQYIDRFHPCAVDNGKCAGYCLAVPYANGSNDGNNNRVVLQRICV